MRVHTAAASAITRASVLPLTAAASLLTSRMILSEGGTEPFAVYALLVSIPMLVPFLDFGLGAAVVNAAAQQGSQHRAALPDVFVASGQLLVRIAFAGILAVVAVGAGWSWAALLGAPPDLPSADPVATACLVLLMANIPLALGNRVLIGSGKNHWAILVSALTPLLTAPAVFVLVQFGQSGWAPLAFFVALTSSNLVATRLALRTQPSLRGSVVRCFWGSRPPVRLRGTSLPMFIQIAAGSIAVHADRLLLSHMSTTDEVGQYHLSSQLYLAVLSLISAAGISLWPMYASRNQYKSPLAASAIFTTAAAILCAVIYPLAPTVLGFASAGVGLTVGPLVYLGWSAMITAYAFIYPIGMSLNDEEGLSRQVPFQLAALVMNLAISVALIPSFGAAAPLFGSAASIVVAQCLPLGVYAHRRSQRAATTPD